LPAKFEESIIEALGQAPERPAVLNNIEDLPQRFTVMDADAAAIKQFIIEKTS
jgi:threonine synthase